MIINKFTKEQLENVSKIKELLKNRNKESSIKIIDLLNTNSRINKENTLKKYNDRNISKK